MPARLTWNAPGAKWNSGLTWNSARTTAKKMKIKAIIDFTPYTAAELGPVAQSIHDGLATHAAHFPALPVSLAALQTLITTCNQKLAARASRATADVLAFNLARHDLEVALGELGGYVNLVAKGEATLVEESAFPAYGGVATPPSAIPAAPVNLVLRPGDLSGTITARCKPDRPASMNVAQTNAGDPNNAAGWVPAATFGGGKITLGGLTVGSTVWVRIATVGTGGVVGAWSDPARIVVV